MAKVFKVSEIELASGVTAEEFERFAVEEYLPAAAFSGMKAHFLRGNRGERDRRFLLAWEFQSMEHRNSVFPGSETPSLEAARWIESHADLVKEWNAMLSASRNTDYVHVAVIAATTGSRTDGFELEERPGDHEALDYTKAP